MKLIFDFVLFDLWQTYVSPIPATGKLKTAKGSMVLNASVNRDIEKEVQREALFVQVRKRKDNISGSAM